MARNLSHLHLNGRINILTQICFKRFISLTCRIYVIRRLKGLNYAVTNTHPLFPALVCSPRFISSISLVIFSAMRHTVVGHISISGVIQRLLNFAYAYNGVARAFELSRLYSCREPTTHRIRTL